MYRRGWVRGWSRAAQVPAIACNVDEDGDLSAHLLPRLGENSPPGLHIRLCAARSRRRVGRGRRAPRIDRRSPSLGATRRPVRAASRSPRRVVARRPIASAGRRWTGRASPRRVRRRGRPAIRESRAAASGNCSSTGPASGDNTSSGTTAGKANGARSSPPLAHRMERVVGEAGSTAVRGEHASRMSVRMRIGFRDGECEESRRAPYTRDGMQIADRVAVVTGAAIGSGRAIAERGS